jgi:hypothetical protein
LLAERNKLVTVAQKSNSGWADRNNDEVGETVL